MEAFNQLAIMGIGKDIYITKTLEQDPPGSQAVLSSDWPLSVPSHSLLLVPGVDGKLKRVRVVPGTAAVRRRRRRQGLGPATSR